MFCMNCGEKLPDTAKFCYKCGEKISSNTDEKNSKMLFDAEDDEDDICQNEEPAGVSSNATAAKENLEEEDDEDEEPGIPTPAPAEPDEYEEDEEDEDDEDDDGEEDILSSLSTASPKSNMANSTEETQGRGFHPSSSLMDPVNDPYWDDVLPEIDNEINKTPKDVILKGIGIVAALFIVMAWLIFLT